MQTASSSRKFERIPIIKYEEEYNSLGRIIYKGFVPRSSDNYFKQLKEVDTEKPM